MTLHAKLHRLFLVDRQLHGLNARLSGARARHRKHNARYKELSTQNDRLLTQLKEVRATAHNLESDAQGVDTKIQSLRNHMNSVKTDKEYRAILVEVNTLKNEKGKIEDQALESLGRVEALEVEIKDLEALITDAGKKLDLARKEVEEGEAEIAEQLSQLQVERAEAAAEVPSDALSVYEVQSEASDGEPMAGVMEEDRRRLEYTCEGCYIQLPVESVNRLLTRPNELVICPSCGRILFISDNLRESVGSSKKSSSSGA